MGISPSLLRCFFQQEVAKWVSKSIMIVRCNEGGQVDYVDCMADNTRDAFVFKVAHYSDQPEHFDAVYGPPSLEIDAVRDQLLSRAHGFVHVFVRVSVHRSGDNGAVCM